jgi:SAM-dependent methyltransferase
MTAASRVSDQHLPEKPEVERVSGESDRAGAASVSHYLHGTEPEEQARLSLLNDLLNARSLGELKLAGGERILDVGSGLGQLTRAMARAAGPGAYVVGVERSGEQLAEARRRAALDGEEHLVEFRQGDAYRFPLRADEWASFDVAHTRFLLEHLTDPLAAVRLMVEAVRPGGRVVLEDDDHEVMRLWPEPDGFARLWRAYIETYEHLGNDANIGRRLVSLLHEAGAAPARNTWVFFGSCAGERHFAGYVENLVGVVAGARARVVGAGLLGADEFDGAIKALREWGGRADAAIWYAMAWAEGRRAG